MNNITVSRRLTELAHEQERSGANIFQLRALRQAAMEVARLEVPVFDLFRRSGRRALETLPGIGKSVAFTLESILTTERAETLERPDRGREPQTLLSSLPCVGMDLAEKLRDLNITSVEALCAADSGRLATLKLSGKTLTTLMTAARARLTAETALAVPLDEPTLETLLQVDECFRHREGSAWDRDGWRLTARYSETALAYRRGATRDWVVIEFLLGGQKGQRMVVTETSGDQAGRRVVRGRESESRLRATPPTPPTAQNLQEQGSAA